MQIQLLHAALFHVKKMSHNTLSFIWNLQLLFLVYSAYSQVNYYITPSLNVHCPEDPCLTLTQFAADSRISYEANLSLSFLPGNHSLDRKLEFYAVYLSMIKIIGTRRSSGILFVEYVAVSQEGLASVIQHLLS